MFARAFFSVMGVTDPAKHRAYNEYHQLDHRPENLLLPGVAWGDRWVRSPDCAAASFGSDRNFDDSHYLAMYFLRHPLEETTTQWRQLGEDAYQMGRRPDIAWRKNHFQSFLRPIKGYAAARILISPDALPFRPVRGVHFTLSQFDGKAGETHEAFAWYDRVRIPDLLDCRGVAGAWTFVGEDVYAQSPGASSQGASRQGTPPATRITLLYLDEDPLQVLDDIRAKEASWRAAGRSRDNSAVEDVRFGSPYRTIVPWEWDWFDSR